MTNYAGKYCCGVSLNVGNLVYVSTEHFPLACWLSIKLVPHWVGSFPISGIISWVAYHISLPEEYGNIHPTLYSSYLHPHIGPVPTHPFLPLLLDDDAAGEFNVEDILDSHLGCYGTEYLIKWLSYPIFEAIWKPAEDLAHAPDILH